MLWPIDDKTIILESLELNSFPLEILNKHDQAGKPPLPVFFYYLLYILFVFRQSTYSNRLFDRSNN